ncbi:hypothetical protein OH76DRAFT_25340 [Lentinus brumalis]|uniref:Uncharacterized protein n=1 Tax=Lentinus brumalis TaxID=2498619 RepID=A0A371DXH6_9APHY|nr:hypothetical protein OH76DRAFT_25340 [Polyporus brumalis]
MIPTLPSFRRCDSSTRDGLVFSHRRLRPTISQKLMHKQASFFRWWTLAGPPQPSHVALCTVCHYLHIATHRAHQPLRLAAGTSTGGHWDTRDGRGRFDIGSYGVRDDQSVSLSGMSPVRVHEAIASASRPLRA